MILQAAIKVNSTYLISKNGVVARYGDIFLLYLDGVIYSNFPKYVDKYTIEPLFISTEDSLGTASKKLLVEWNLSRNPYGSSIHVTNQYKGSTVRVSKVKRQSLLLFYKQYFRTLPGYVKRTLRYLIMEKKDETDRKYDSETNGGALLRYDSYNEDQRLPYSYLM